MSDLSKPNDLPNTYTESAESVLAGLSVRGRPVSRTQLARWHRAGYIPKPVQVSQGRGHGTISFYPVGTRDQAVALCTFLSRERDLNAAGWSLWWYGYTISMLLIRSVLEASAKSWYQFVEALQPQVQADNDDLPDDLSEAAWDLLDRSPQTRSSRTSLRRARKRVGRENFPTLLRFVFLIASGRFTGYADTVQTPIHERQRTLVDKGLGLVPRWMKSWPYAEQISQQTEASAVDFSRALSDVDPRAVLQAATDTDLLGARDVVQGLLQWLEQFLGVLALMGEAAGVAHLQEAIHSFDLIVQSWRAMSMPDQSTTVLMVLLARSWGPDMVMQILTPMPSEARAAVMNALFPSVAIGEGQESRLS
jgi:hypothetical protein